MERGGDLRRRDRAEHAPVLSRADGEGDLFPVELFCLLSEHLFVFRFMVGVRRAALLRFVDPACGRDFRKSFFEEEISGVAVRDFNNVSLLAAALHVRL